LDKTSEIVRREFLSERTRKAFLGGQPGKAAALNMGLRYANGEIVIALDADTLFARQTVGALAHRFSDPRMEQLPAMPKLVIG